jgi:hypothetical protein
MAFSKVPGRYYQTDSDDFPRSISWQQLFVLHVAACACIAPLRDLTSGMLMHPLQQMPALLMPAM